MGLLRAGGSGVIGNWGTVGGIDRGTPRFCKLRYSLKMVRFRSFGILKVPLKLLASSH